MMEIYNLSRTQAIEIPKRYTYTVSEEELGTELVMADGSIVFEETGLRKVVTMTCGYLPDADYKNLLAIRRLNPFVYLRFTDLDGISEGIYRMTVGERELWSIRNDGTAQFKGPDLEFRQQEVG